MDKHRYWTHGVSGNGHCRLHRKNTKHLLNLSPAAWQRICFRCPLWTNQVLGPCYISLILAMCFPLVNTLRKLQFLCLSTRLKVRHQKQRVKFFSTTTDLWTSAAGGPYITFTTHYINNNWELTSYCLQIYYLPEDHTGANIVEVLEETLQQWKLEDKKLVGITTDSGANVKLARSLLNWVRLSCFG